MWPNVESCYRGNQVSGRLLERILIQYDWRLIQRGHVDTETYLVRKETGEWRWVMLPQVKERLGQQELEGARRVLIWRFFRRSMALTTLRFQTSSLQNCEIVYFCFLFVVFFLAMLCGMLDRTHAPCKEVWSLHWTIREVLFLCLKLPCLWYWLWES